MKSRENRRSSALPDGVAEDLFCVPGGHTF